MKRWRYALIVLLLFPAIAFAQSPPTQQVIEYYHTDAQGNVRAVTNQQGQVIRRFDYLPFGELFNPPNPPTEKRLFSGKERDFETALDYFGARYYRPGLGRFTTVDPGYASAMAHDPQSWNAYAYGRNNPFRFFDPDGRRWFAKNGQAVWVEPNKDGTYTSPGDGWVELDPKNYDYRMNVAFVDGTLSWIGEDPKGRKMLAPWSSPERGLEDTTFSFLAPIQVAAGVASAAVRTLAANRLPDIGFKLLTPATAVTKDAVRFGIVKQVMLKQAGVGQLVKGVIVLEGRTVSYTAFRHATGEIVVTSIRIAQ